MGPDGLRDEKHNRESPTSQKGRMLPTSPLGTQAIPLQALATASAQSKPKISMEGGIADASDLCILPIVQ